MCVPIANVTMEKINNLNERNENVDTNSRKRKCTTDEREEQPIINGNLSPEVKANFVLVSSLPEDRRDLVSSHSGALGPITSIGGTSGTFSSSTRLTHTPTSADFQPPYFPPPYNIQPQQLEFHHHAQAAAAAAVVGDPYSHLNSLTGPQQYHHPQIHSSQPSRNAHVLQTRGRDESELHLQSNMHAGIHTGYGDVTMASSRRTANDMYANMRRPDVLMHSSHHAISDQDLLNLHNNTALPLDDTQGGGVDDNASLFSPEHNSVIRKGMVNGNGIKSRNSENHKDMIISGMTAPNDVFCSVPGRLSLLSSTSKYKVTVGEVQRRLSPPECLNASLLGGVLRRAKSKNGGKSLREKLEKIGLNLPAGRRKAANVTLLTSLVEGEAVHLARDFRYVCETEFPARQIAEYLSRSHSEPADAVRRREVVLATKQLVKEFVDLLTQDRSPLCNTRTQPVLDSSIQRNLTHFSLITHGFGSPAIVAALTSMQSFLTESLKYLDKQLTNYPNAAGLHSNSSGMIETKKEIDLVIKK